MAGLIGGMILSEAERSLPYDMDVSKARKLLLVAETHYLNGYLQTLKDEKDGG